MLIVAAACQSKNAKNAEPDWPRVVRFAFDHVPRLWRSARRPISSLPFIPVCRAGRPGAANRNKGEGFMLDLSPRAALVPCWPWATIMLSLQDFSLIRSARMLREPPDLAVNGWGDRPSLKASARPIASYWRWTDGCDGGCAWTAPAVNVLAGPTPDDRAWNRRAVAGKAEVGGVGPIVQTQGLVS